MLNDLTTEIRNILPNELHLFEDLLYDAIFQRTDEPPLPKEIINEPCLRIYIEDWGRPGDMCLVVLVNGVIAGAVWTRLFSDALRGYGYVNDKTPEIVISLFKPYRQKGIGTSLMQTMLSKLKEAGYRQVSLSVTKDNPAYRLYLKLGFDVVEERNEDYLMVAELSKI